jgi:hypothetical protein
MSLMHYLEKISVIDSLIKRKATGDQKGLAVKMQISRSGLNNLLNEMRQLGFPIKYDHRRKTYYYEENGRMVSSLFIKDELHIEELKENDLKQILGGRHTDQYLFPYSHFTQQLDIV